MRDQYTPPKASEEKFHCIHCGVYSQQTWYRLTYSSRTTNASICLCTHCGVASYWVGKRLMFPASGTGRASAPGSTRRCKPDYEEASAVFVHSPRASAALIRLAIQKLMAALGQPGKNINDDIKALVARGLPVRIQQALDVCRVVGNNAVHPGEMDLNDTPEVAQSLFRLTNIIVEEMITKPKEIESIYNALPEGARSAIAKRDANP